MTKKNIAREETRQALIEAFWKLLKDKSADKMTVSEIARVAGYNRSTFYEYFFDVPDVLQQVEDGILQEMNFGIPKNDRIPMAQVVDVFERNAEPLSPLGRARRLFLLLPHPQQDETGVLRAGALGRRGGGLPNRVGDRAPRRGHHGFPALLAEEARPPLRRDLSPRPPRNRP